MFIKNDFQLPRDDKPPLNLALLVVGRAMAEVYRTDLDRPLPEPLARIVREIEQREAGQKSSGC